MPADIAKHLVDEFLKIRRDVASRTLERAAPGKFVESVVQALQFLEAGKYDAAPSIDAYLRTIESKPAPPPDGLRICAARIARAMYTLRSKRNILHKGEVDPNTYDLQFLLAAAQWTLAEFVRNAAGLSMEEAGKLVDQVQAPVGGLVEDLGSRKLVLADVSIGDEILLLLHSTYPEIQPVVAVVSSLDRRSAGSVKNKLRELWKEKKVHGDAKGGYSLTATGLKAAIVVIQRLA